MPEKWTDYQKEAIEHFGHNILVSAGAGSGKTAVLSQRVYQLVGKRKIDVDRLLVLTFTNKAAAEMKTRIREKILKDEEGLFDSEEKRLDQVNRIDSSYIMTFDAYALFLVRKYHELLNIDKDIAVIDPNILINEEEKLLDEIMEEEYRNKDAAFMRLIGTFCVKDDDAIRTFIRELNHKLETIYERESFVSDYPKLFYSKEGIKDCLKQYVAYLKRKIGSIRNLIEEFAFGVEDVDIYFSGLDDLFRADSYEQIREAAVKAETTKKRLPSGSGVSEIRKEISEKLKQLKKLCLSDEQTLIEETESTLSYDLCLLAIAEKLNGRLCAFKKEKRLYDFADIFRMSIDLVSRYSWVCEEIREGFAEILIDEYQDTNDLQDEFIARISDHNVYMVGDIKQSIYRFRNANPILFLKKYHKYLNGDDGELIVLPHNFRSRREVIEDVNVIFDRLMDDQIGGADYRKSHHMEAGRDQIRYNDQNNSLEILNYRKPEEGSSLSVFSKQEIEAFIMAKDILEKAGSFEIEDENTVRKAQYKDFCVIVDRGNNFDLYKQVFTYCGIPCIIDREDKMADSDLIHALKAVFSLLEHLYDENYDYDFRFAFLSLARSFLVRMPDEQIYEIFHNDTFLESEPVLELLPLKEKLPYESLTGLLNEIIGIFDVYEKLYLIGDVHENLVKIDYLFQLCHTLSASAYDYRAFNRYLEQIFDEGDRDITYRIDQEAEDAVRIINIHKAKGLQYKICYFPALDVDFNQSDLKDRFLFSKEAGIVTPVMVEGRGLKQSIRKTLFNEEYLKEDIGEKLRLFYVGLTRTQEKMIMVASLENDDRGEKIIDDEQRTAMKNFAGMLESICGDLERHGFIRDVDLSLYPLSKDYRFLKEKELSELAGQSKEKIAVPERAVIQPEAIESSSFSKKAALIDAEMIRKMDFGTKLHQYLELLDFSDPDYSKIDPAHVSLIRAFMDSDLMRNAKQGKAYKEYEFFYEDDNEMKHGFIDLLMEYEDHFDIIDYKTKNIDDEHYDEQLRGYRTYIGSISDKQVNCYLYSIMDGEYREVI